MAKTSDLVEYKNNKIILKKVPAAGENISIYARPGDIIDFDLVEFDMTGDNVKLIGGDIILNLPDGGSFTFVSMALMGYNESSPPLIKLASGKTLTLDMILSEIEEINAVPLESIVTNVESTTPTATNVNTQTSKAQEITIQEQNEENDNTQLDLLAEDFTESAPEENENVSIFVTKADDVSVKKDSASLDAEVEGTTPSLSFIVDVQHVFLTSNTDNDVLTVFGGSGSSYENISSRNE